MDAEPLEFLSAVLVVSEHPERLAAFYRDVLGVPLEPEQHGATATHWGCQLGDLHFAIHPVANFRQHPGVGAVRLAFTVFDLDTYVAAVRRRGVEPLYPPKDLGWSKMTAVRDPDGNHIELTQLTNDWFDRLAQRRHQGHDVLARWRQRKPQP